MMRDIVAKPLGPAALRMLGRLPGYAVALVLAFALVIGCFVASTLYADGRLAEIAHRSHEVSDNAMPSVADLGRMRRDLSLVDLHAAELTAGRRSAEDLLAQDLARLDAEESDYLATGWFEDEAALWTETAASLGEIRSAIPELRAHMVLGETAAAEAVRRERIQSVVPKADSGLAALLTLNHEAGKKAALDADATLHRVRFTSYVLDGISASLAVVLAVLTLGTMRRYSSLLRRRADELDAFAARVAHDVRGPLGPALLALGTVKRQLPPDAPLQDAAERGIRSIGRVTQLVEGLLAFAKAGVPGASARAELRTVVAGVLQDLEPKAAEKRVALSAAPLPALEVACAPGVLSSIVENLASNAVKYMPDDVDAPSVTVSAREARSGCVRVEVADNGAGLPAGVRLFEPFVRAGRREPGIGLGLATVRRLAEAHGGRSGAAPRSGGGAVFWFELPLAPRGAPVAQGAAQVGP
jgi:signal transduction histidine kinase